MTVLGEKIAFFSARTYITNVVKRIEELLGITIKSADTLMAEGDHPELNDTHMLTNEENVQVQDVNQVCTLGCHS